MFSSDDFGRDITGYRFGVDNKRLSQVLHEFARELETGERYAIQSVQIEDVATPEDFCEKTLTIKFSEKPAAAVTVSVADAEALEAALAAVAEPRA